MGPTGDSGEKRITSYADVVRGHKRFGHESKSTEEIATVAARKRAVVPTDGASTEQNTAKKISPKKGTRSTQKKGHKPSPTGAHQRASQAGQAAGGSPHKSSPRARTAKKSTKPSFSYAEAVKGKPSPATLQTNQTKNAEARGGVQAAVGSPAHTGVSKSEPDPSPSPKLLHVGLGDGDNLVTFLHRQKGGWSRGVESQNLLELLYGQPFHHFSAGDVSSTLPSSLLPSTTPFSTPLLTLLQILHQASADSKMSQARDDVDARIAGILQAHDTLPNGENVDVAISRAVNNTASNENQHSEDDEVDSDIYFAVDNSQHNAQREWTRLVIASHNRGQISLWGTPRGWNVRVDCRGQSWMLQREILCANSTFFRHRLPRRNPNGIFVIFDCSEQDPLQLVTALQYMYHDDWLKEQMLLRYALVGYAIREATFAYIAGASIGFERMMLDALSALHEIALQLVLFFRNNQRYTLEELDMSGLYEPLALALNICYEQGDGGVWLLPLRASLAHLVDGVMLWLALDQGFHNVPVGSWSQGLWAKTMRESRHFSDLGILDDMWGVMNDVLAAREARGLRPLEARPPDDPPDAGPAGAGGGNGTAPPPAQTAPNTQPYGWLSNGAQPTLDQWERAFTERGLRQLVNPGSNHPQDPGTAERLRFSVRLTEPPPSSQRLFDNTSLRFTSSPYWFGLGLSHHTLHHASRRRLHVSMDRVLLRQQFGIRHLDFSEGTVLHHGHI
ncbi:hypothetical protein F5144DRAFT_40502 [Chaetomium tenue]|uniref:Uncharacterized protein n=1 Tax=Chaetomium tenue TaxID=1854479 RepID=A0ACB7PPQ8_9PEZI|nr:hypothetical protein F5144DRAFT_40502 [Chaetomium globosum]